MTFCSGEAGARPSAQNDAEATVLKTLVRSWKMIADQLDRYAELMDARAVRK
jgi:hypothetical protein